jgi:hypothetical protein
MRLTASASRRKIGGKLWHVDRSPIVLAARRSAEDCHQERNEDPPARTTVRAIAVSPLKARTRTNVLGIRNGRILDRPPGQRRFASVPGLVDRDRSTNISLSRHHMFTEVSPVDTTQLPRQSESSAWLRKLSLEMNTICVGVSAGTVDGAGPMVARWPTSWNSIGRFWAWAKRTNPLARTSRPAKRLITVWKRSAASADEVVQLKVWNPGVADAVLGLAEVAGR